jgi:omega-6 fatty acid desaturase (delta-12 desaturase)
LLNTVLPYLLLWGGTAWMLSAGLPYWTVLPALALAAGLLVRVFIIFHDCCHGSFFPSRVANAVTAYLTGLLAFTPYEAWQHPHHRHHATTGDLDRRGVGDIWTMTVEEYRAARWPQRLRYRISRHPLVMFGCVPILMFFVAHRAPRRGSSPRERRSVLFTNLGLLAVAGVAHLTIGLPNYLLIQVPIMALTASVGMWLFYVQHQYEAVYWSRHAEWDPTRAALEELLLPAAPRVGVVYRKHRLPLPRPPSSPHSELPAAAMRRRAAGGSGAGAPHAEEQLAKPHPASLERAGTKTGLILPASLTAHREWVTPTRARNHNPETGSAARQLG